MNIKQVTVAVPSCEKGKWSVEAREVNHIVYNSTYEKNVQRCFDLNFWNITVPTLWIMQFHVRREDSPE